MIAFASLPEHGPARRDPSLGPGARVALYLLTLSVAAATTPLALRSRDPEPIAHEIAGSSTPLRGRGSNQRHNAALAARSLDGCVVLPGEVFSFNRRVQVWSAQRGYRKAPISYEGVLVPAVGGGVCQVSSTLYNAVLTAGLPIVERHRHAVAPLYVPPGRDAAVAQGTLDFRFKNALSAPLRIRTAVSDGMLTVRLFCSDAVVSTATIMTKVLSSRPPRRVARAEPDADQVRRTGNAHGRGAAGFRVVTYRCFYEGGREVLRERVSDDTYQAVDYVLEPTEQAGGVFER